MVLTAGCGHRPIGSGSREVRCRYVFPYVPPERKSVLFFPSVGHASRRTGSYWYTGRYTTARHRFTSDRDRTPNPARSPTSPVRALMPGHGHLLRLICTILPVVQSLLSSLCAGQSTPTSAPTLVHVAVAHGRVFCPECHGENDGMFHFY